MKDPIQREYMMVNPQEIVIDMPCDPANVETKKASILQMGIVQPITIWIEGFRVIDGFHRVKAAQDLGLAEVPATLIDCSEEAFWDARIQSAKQHHGIEDERLAEWMYESWCTSELATEKTKDELFRFIWDHKLDTALNWNVNTRRSVPGPFLDWFQSKSAKWGMEWPKVAAHLLALARGKRIYDPRTLADGFTFEEALRIARGVPDGISHHIDSDIAREFLSHPDSFDAPAVAQNAMRRIYLKHSELDKQQDAEERERQRNILFAIAEKREEQERQFLKTEQGKAVHRKRRMEAIADDIERILRLFADYSLDEWDEPFTLAEAIAEDKRVKAQVNLLSAACVEFWELAGKPLTSEMLALENQELRNENQRLQFRLNEYERKATAAQDRKNKRAAVLSSTDIENIPEA